MLNSVTGTKVRFFDQNPIGRIMNRFTMDVGNIDDAIPTAIHEGICVSLVFDLSTGGLMKELAWF
jgi:hypothetical protein